MYKRQIYRSLCRAPSGRSFPTRLRSAAADLDTHNIIQYTARDSSSYLYRNYMYWIFFLQVDVLWKTADLFGRKYVRMCRCTHTETKIFYISLHVCISSLIFILLWNCLHSSIRTCNLNIFKYIEISLNCSNWCWPVKMFNKVGYVHVQRKKEIYTLKEMCIRDRFTSLSS